MIKKIFYTLVLLPMMCSISCDEWKIGEAQSDLSDDTNDQNNKKKEYQVIFKNGDTILDTLSVKNGLKPTYDKSIPYKETVANNESTTFYKFVGWSEKENISFQNAYSTSNLPAVTRDTTYFAIFQTIEVKGVFTYSDSKSSIISGFTNNEVTELIMPHNVKSIAEGAFDSSKSFTQLKSITIPNTITNIGNNAFRNCTSLESVLFSDNGKVNTAQINIGDYTFSNCSSLTSIFLPNNTKSIGNNAFANCTSLDSIVLPDSITSIGSNAFNGCTSLASATLPKNLQEISKYLFYNCSKLKTLNLPDNITKIGASAFSCCNLLTSINIPSSVTSLGDLVFNECTSLKSIKLPDSIGNNIGYDTFFKCTSLTSVTLPKDLEAINKNMFYSCSSLSSITIPNKVYGIAIQAFAGCSSLTSLVLPESVEIIGASSFIGCTSLTSLTVTTNITTIGSSAFDGIPSLEITYPGTTEQFSNVESSGASSNKNVKVNCTDGSLFI